MTTAKRRAPAKKAVKRTVKKAAKRRAPAKKAAKRTVFRAGARGRSNGTDSGGPARKA